MSWGTRRRNSIVFIIFIIILIPIAILAFNFFYKPVSCFDGIYNGIETGIDCGGGCSLLCNNAVIEPIVSWKRFFEVTPGVYNVIAYVENPNPEASVQKIPYIFRLYDAEGVLLQERKGSTEIGPKERLPIVENSIFTNKLAPSRVAFEFTEEFVFEKGDPQEQVIAIKNEELINEETAPRVQATLQNIDILEVKNISAIVIVYDINGNAIASSSTVIESLRRDQAVPIIFTWPQPFKNKVSRIEIIPIYDSPKK